MSATLDDARPTRDTAKNGDHDQHGMESDRVEEMKTLLESNGIKDSEANKLLLLEKRLGLQPYTPMHDSQLGSNHQSHIGHQKDDVMQSNSQGVVSINSSGGHHVSDTPAVSAEEDGMQSMKRNLKQEISLVDVKKRRVKKQPVRYGGERTRKQQSPSGQRQLDGAAKASPGIEQRNRIEKYLVSKSGHTGMSDFQAAPHDDGTSRRELVKEVVGDDGVYLRTLKNEVESLRKENGHLQEDLKQTQKACDHLEDTVASLEKQVADSKLSTVSQSEGFKGFVAQLARENAKKERALSQHKLQEDAPRLGTLSVQRKGIDVQEVWENGSAITELKEKYKNLLKQKESIETMRKATKRRLPLPGQALPEKMDCQKGACSDTGPLHPDDWMLQEEIYKVRLSAIRREEEMLKSEGQRLEIEKNAHILEIKRLRDEEASRFGNHPILNGRYLLLELLGKGGFSEVFKSLDLRSLTYVAVKIHQLSSQWSESKKASYVKHSVREYHIHKQLHHPRIVSLLDIFEIDNNTFATVLEYCSGGDLEGYMKSHGSLPEREAKSIIAQVLSALCYLNVKPRSFIHYDLKPANILFDQLGQCKITDFGLSKVVEEGHTQGMELTSQGAGTYWYLPPECFDINRTPLISNKVDVWSVGVILYQMLYSRRPFGHELSQEQILRNEVMLNAREVQFPSKPSVTTECKDFITKCLMYRQEQRPDVHEAMSHPFLNIKKRS
ncbi:Serine/threonine-protein kinase TOUSLED [Picochlorum sp. SENEW3]|nr:Serine/threonine-protein kinase TOUSLED [Picochlorum sp. SENEW3]